MISVQSVRDLVRPVLTAMVASGYYCVIIIATYNKLITGKEALAAVTVPLMMMMTYHFSKTAKRDG